MEKERLRALFRPYHGSAFANQLADLVYRNDSASFKPRTFWTLSEARVGFQELAKNVWNGHAQIITDPEYGYAFICLSLSQMIEIDRRLSLQDSGETTSIGD